MYSKRMIGPLRLTTGPFIRPLHARKRDYIPAHAYRMPAFYYLGFSGYAQRLFLFDLCPEYHLFLMKTCQKYVSKNIHNFRIPVQST